MSLAAENFQLMADKGILFDKLSSLFLLLLSGTIHFRCKIQVFLLLFRILD